MSLTFHILVFLLTVLTLSIPLATFAQQDSTVAENEVLPTVRFISAGIFGTLVPVEGVRASGNKIGLIHDEPTYAVGIEFRYADGETGYRCRGPNQSYGEQANFLKFGSLSIGGRYFSFNKWSISPYIGGGLTVIGIEYETIVRRAHFSSVGTSLWDALVSLGQSNPSWDYDIRSESNFGMGAYGVCGIEFRKFRNHRLKLELRMDRPFFKLPSRDLMPITVGITYFTSSLFGCLGGGWSFLFKSPFE